MVCENFLNTTRFRIFPVSVNVHLLVLSCLFVCPGKGFGRYYEIFASISYVEERKNKVLVLLLAFELQDEERGRGGGARKQRYL